MAPITGSTRLVGVIGWPVKHSLSPQMHNAAFRELGMDWFYLPFPVPPESLEAAVNGLRALGIVGVNVVIPHKQAILPLMDSLDASAAAAGAVNTVSSRNGRLIGYNTDGEGFLRALARAGCDPRGRRAAVLGAGGGGARAVAAALAGAGVESLRLINRTAGKAEALAGMIREQGWPVRVETAPWEPEAMRAAVEEADLVINATPIGMWPHQQEPPPVPPEWLHSGQVVCDLVYRPEETALLRAARERGAQPVSGATMLVEQGAIAFQIWTGVTAPLETMERAVRRSLAGETA